MFKSVYKLKSLKERHVFFHKKKLHYLNDDIITSIYSIFGKNNVSHAEAIRSHHSKDESFHKYALSNFTYINRNLY